MVAEVIWVVEYLHLASREDRAQEIKRAWRITERINIKEESLSWEYLSCDTSTTNECRKVPFL